MASDLSTGDRAAEHERLIEVLSRIVPPLGRALPASIEVVLHDLAKLPRSIVAVHGDVTGRRIGDPATDLLLGQASSKDFGTIVGYRTELPDGRLMRSTTIIVRDSADEAVAALCINADLSTWQALHRITGAMVGPGEALAPPAADDDLSVGPSEAFVRDVDELASHLIHEAIREQGVPVDLMKKSHKLAVVRSLQARGMFLLRDAVEMIAHSLGVTRFTIYNYLNEIADSEGVDAETEAHR